MRVCRSFQELREFLNAEVEKGLTIGLVPTMGALHQGHLSLVQKSKQTCDITVCSIFVNPAQFNKVEDLEKYPRTEEADLVLLESGNCDVVIIPEVADVYPAGYPLVSVELNGIDVVMEGIHRPGHFAGVVQVVGRFFEAVKPQVSYFGDKDYQQLAVIKKMVLERKFPVEVIGCPTLREKSGLAMSSRNLRLSEKAIKTAALIKEQLDWAKSNFDFNSIAQIEQIVRKVFESHPDFELEYFEIASADNLLPVKTGSGKVRAFIAARIEGVRLIDNLAMN